MVWPFSRRPNQEAAAADAAVDSASNGFFGRIIGAVTWLPRQALGAVGNGLNWAAQVGAPAALISAGAGLVTGIIAKNNGEDVNLAYRVVGSTVVGTGLIAAGAGVAGTTVGVGQSVLDLFRGTGAAVENFTAQTTGELASPVTPDTLPSQSNGRA